MTQWEPFFNIWIDLITHQNQARHRRADNTLAHNPRRPLKWYPCFALQTCTPLYTPKWSHAWFYALPWLGTTFPQRHWCAPWSLDPQSSDWGWPFCAHTQDLKHWSEHILATCQSGWLCRVGYASWSTLRGYWLSFQRLEQCSHTSLACLKHQTSTVWQQLSLCCTCFFEQGLVYFYDISFAT